MQVVLLSGYFPSGNGTRTIAISTLKFPVQYVKVRYLEEAMFGISLQLSEELLRNPYNIHCQDYKLPFQISVTNDFIQTNHVIIM